jgi:late competence protein required for DNA uptake (superfamily II DNA/RNA helicase)
MFTENKGFGGFQRVTCDICKKHTVLVSDKHVGKIVCKKCYKLERKNKCYTYLSEL